MSIIMPDISATYVPFDPIPDVPVKKEDLAVPDVAVKMEDNVETSPTLARSTKVLPKKNEVKKTSSRFADAKDSRAKTQQSLQDDQDNLREKKRLDRLKKRREEVTSSGNQQNPPDEGEEEQTMKETPKATPNDNSAMKLKRLGLKDNNLVETSKAKMLEEDQVARAQKSQAKRDARRLQAAAAAAAAREQRDANAETPPAKEVRDEAEQLLARIQKVEEERKKSADKKASS
jgi:hypothetical protein